MAIEKRVEVHIIFSKYIFPYLVLGSSLTESTMVLLKDYSKAGTGRVELHVNFDSVCTQLRRCYKINSSWLRLVLYSASQNGPISRWRFR